jgi:hypothetical protein
VFHKASLYNVLLVVDFLLSVEAYIHIAAACQLARQRKQSLVVVIYGPHFVHSILIFIAQHMFLK